MVEMKSLYFDNLDDPPADSGSTDSTDNHAEPETDTDTDKNTEIDEVQCVCRKCDFSNFEVEERWGLMTFIFLL